MFDAVNIEFIDLLVDTCTEIQCKTLCAVLANHTKHAQVQQVAQWKAVRQRTFNEDERE